jgi:hypothetical protein
MKPILKIAGALLILITLSFFILPLTGQENGNKNNPSDNPTVVIDSCEYITFKNGSAEYAMVHKGNCVFCRAWVEQLLKK